MVVVCHHLVVVVCHHLMVSPVNTFYDSVKKSVIPWYVGNDSIESIYSSSCFIFCLVAVFCGVLEVERGEGGWVAGWVGIGGPFTSANCSTNQLILLRLLQMKHLKS